MKIDLSGRIAIITGASRSIGIGATIARTLAAAGADIFITHYTPYDRLMPWGGRSEEAEQLLAELNAAGVRAVGMQVDLAQPDSPAMIFNAVVEQLGAPAILVNNATHSENGDIEVLDAAQMDRHYAVNVRGATMLCREFVMRWGGALGGRIINLTSGQGVTPMPGELAYITTKGAIEAFTVSLAAGVARRGITVNAIDPGVTDTGWINPELMAQFLPQMPFGRVGIPQDAANLICFLASEQGGWITGQVIHSRGGF